MAASAALKMLFDLANEAVEVAMQNLAVANKALQESEQKGQMLAGYKQDYIAQYQQKLSQGVGKEQHLNYQQFLQNLQQVIDGQGDIVISARYERDKMQALLVEAQRKKMSYDVLIKRGDQKAALKALKQEQKLMDEFAMRRKAPQQ